MVHDLDLAKARRRLQRRRLEIMARYQAEAAWQVARRRGAPRHAQQDLSWVRLLSNEDATTLLRIFEALRRIDHGTYGICVACGQVIEAERLRAEPEAHQCQICVAFSFAAASEPAPAAP